MHWSESDVSVTAEAGTLRWTCPVAFFASCASRFVALYEDASLPPLVCPPGLGTPSLHPSRRTEGGTYTYTLAWQPQTDPTEHQPKRAPQSTPRCDLCASKATHTTHHCDTSGTGWRSVNHEVQCQDCQAYTRCEIDD